MGKLGEKNREAFYNDVDLKGNDCKNKLRIILVINQYNEGIHAPGVDGVILGRKTMSDIVLFEWLGRALTVGRNLKKETEKLMNYSKEELQKMCLDKDISIEEDTFKEELISKLLSPLVIDLACNYKFIEELENKLKDRIKQVSEKTGNTKRKIAITDASFDIEVENIDILKALIDLKERLSNSWYKMYEYAKIYYEHHGNLEIPKGFKTNNGWKRDTDGKINLGTWINNQRHSIAPTSERGKLLLAIKMRFEKIKNILSWEEMYEYAKIYYEHHGNLKVPVSFKTNNGWERDETGKINLGDWINNQRRRVSPNSERGKLLLTIKMCFETKKNLTWEEMYKYAKIYYEHHGDLKVPRSFKTNNGWERDEDGKINLGTWINTQKNAYKTGNLSFEQISKLESIGIIWFTKNIDNKLQAQQITDKNAMKKQKEILNRMKSLLNNIEVKEISSKDDIDNINKQFIKQLSLNKKRNY